MTHEEMIERAKAWLTTNHPTAPSAEHQVARYADFALAVLEEERGKRPVVGKTADGVEVRSADYVYAKCGLRGECSNLVDLETRWYSTPSAAEEASRG